MLCRFLIFVVLCDCILDITHGDDSGNFLLRVYKNVPRIGKRNGKSNAAFENFIMKVSKSIPRIGRRSENIVENHEESTGSDYTDTKIKYPTWSEIAERYEYQPELFSSPELLRKLEEEIGDDPTLYDWDKVRLKRSARGQNRHN